MTVLLMNRQITIALLGTAFAVAAGLIVTGTVSATPLLVAQSTTTQETGSMLGHVTYQVTDSTGQVKKYVQTDNTVVDTGKKCAITMLFQHNKTSVCTLVSESNAANGVNWLSIGNGTGPAVSTSTTTLPFQGTNYKNSTVQVSPTLSQPGGSGTSGVATLSRLFSFNSANFTTISSSALSFQKVGAGTLFAVKDGLGVAVSPGDTLTITWTVNVG